MAKYELVRNSENEQILLGGGRFGLVKLARRLSDSQLFACKTMPYGLDAPREKVIQECQLLKRLRHPNITQYVGMEAPQGEWEIKMYMEYCDQGDLQQLIDVSKSIGKLFSPSMVRAVIRDLADALEYCHNGPNSRVTIQHDSTHWESVLHRDIKPQNVFLKMNPRTQKYIYKLGDFGLGTILRSGSNRNTYAGTPQYMAPEITHDTTMAFQWSDKCDIFSLGCTFYTLCMLEPPFEWQMDSASSMLLRIWSLYDLSIRRLIYECLSYEPQDRPSAKDIGDDRWVLLQNAFSTSEYKTKHIHAARPRVSPARVTIDQALQELNGNLEEEEDDWAILPPARTSTPPSLSTPIVSTSSNADFFNTLLQQFNELQQRTMVENLEMQKAQAFWNPLETMSKRDATS